MRLLARSLAVGVLSALLVLVPSGARGGTAPVAAAAPVPPAPVVVSAIANPRTVPYTGAVVLVTGFAEHASTCQLVLASRQRFPVVYSHNPKGCGAGRFTARATIGPNSSALSRTVAFRLVARRGAVTSSRQFLVHLAPAPFTRVTQATASPDAIGPAGATVVVRAEVDHALTCQLELLSHQAFAVVYSHNPKPCPGGAFTAHVTVGPNPAALPRTVALVLVARNQASSSRRVLYIDMGPAKSPTTPTTTPPSVPSTTVPSTTVPPTTVPSTTVPSTTVPSTTTTTLPAGPPAPNTQPRGTPVVPDNQVQSSNWSGYAVVGGPYSMATGTFTVPTSVGGSSGQALVSQWVGLDGFQDGDQDLIQAGIDEQPDPQSSTGFDIQPWWEILPAAATDISTLAVSPGDKVTVTIWQVSTSNWQIRVADDTTSQTFTTPQLPYSGIGTSVEWVVEAASQCELSCEISQVAPYSPPVSFSALGMRGAANTELDQITMVQDDQAVSTPSALASDGFTVTYTGPALSDRRLNSGFVLG